MPTSFSAGPTLDRLISPPNVLRGQQPSQSRMPSPRTQQEIDALRGIDEIKAQQAAQAQYRQYHPKGRGLLGAAQELWRNPKKDERMQGFRDTAMQGLTQARSAEDLAATRLAGDEMRLTDYDNNVTAGAASQLADNQQRLAGINNQASALRNTDTIQGADARNTANIQGADARNTANIQGQADRQEDAQRFTGNTNEVQTWHDGKGGVINTYQDPGTRQHFAQDAGGARIPVDTSGLTPYSPSQTEGSRSLSARNTQDMNRLDVTGQQIIDDMQASQLGRIMNFGDLEAATGNFDFRRYAARWMPVGERARANQSMGRVLNNARTIALAPILSIMGVNPTDKDMAVAMEGAPTAKLGPQAWIDYVRYEFAPVARQTALARIRDGNILDDRTVEDINTAYMELLKLADDAEQRIYGGGDAAAGVPDFDPSVPLSVDPATLSPEQRQARRDAINNR